MPKLGDAVEANFQRGEHLNRGLRLEWSGSAVLLYRLYDGQVDGDAGLGLCPEEFAWLREALATFPAPDPLAKARWQAKHGGET
jgi:hypothetical protein